MARMSRRDRIKEITSKIFKDVFTYGFVQADIKTPPPQEQIYSMKTLEECAKGQTVDLEVVDPVTFRPSPTNVIGKVVNIRMEGNWLAGDVEIDKALVLTNPLAKLLVGANMKTLPLYLIGTGIKKGDVVEKFVIARACVNPTLKYPADVVARYLGP